MQVKNKWNKKMYIVLEKNGDKVTLCREDNSTFIISYKEYKTNYYEVETRR